MSRPVYDVLASPEQLVTVANGRKNETSTRRWRARFR
jgi:hypothetical protein